jgi:hypothetical protein
MDILDETYKGMWLSPRIKVLLQLGHGREAHLHPDYQRLVRQAILWSAGR